MSVVLPGRSDCGVLVAVCWWPCGVCCLLCGVRCLLFVACCFFFVGFFVLLDDCDVC